MDTGDPVERGTLRRRWRQWQERLEIHKPGVTLFIDRPDVPATNNATYAARGISLVMPRSELCRVGASRQRRSSWDP